MERYVRCDENVHHEKQDIIVSGQSLQIFEHFNSIPRIGEDKQVLKNRGFETGCPQNG